MKKEFNTMNYTMNRREFVVALTGGAAALTVLPTTSFASADAVKAEMDKFIGHATIARPIYIDSNFCI